MKVIQATIYSYLVFLGMILRRLFLWHDNPHLADDSASLAAAVIRERAWMAAAAAEVDAKQKFHPAVPSSDPLSFSMQLANLQQSLYRASQPTVVMQPVAVSRVH